MQWRYWLSWYLALQRSPALPIPGVGLLQPFSSSLSVINVIPKTSPFYKDVVFMRIGTTITTMVEAILIQILDCYNHPSHLYRDRSCLSSMSSPSIILLFAQSWQQSLQCLPFVVRTMMIFNVLTNWRDPTPQERPTPFVDGCNEDCLGRAL